MILFSVKFKTALPVSDVLRISRERAPRYRALPGLIQKYYGIEKETGEVTGVYIWDSKQSLQEFRDSELARTIPEAYKVEGQPRIEVFDVELVLRS